MVSKSNKQPVLSVLLPVSAIILLGVWGWLATWMGLWLSSILLIMTVIPIAATTINLFDSGGFSLSVLIGSLAGSAVLSATIGVAGVTNLPRHWNEFTERLGLGNSLEFIAYMAPLALAALGALVASVYIGGWLYGFLKQQGWS